jgi:hypothetical protein
VSAIDYTPAAGTDTTLFHDTVALGNAHITNTNPVGGPNMYWRLEVDTLTANGQATCTGTTCTDPNTANLPDASSTAHKGYAVRVLPASGSCTTTTACSISAMDDMTVYTPIINNTGAAEEFTIPLFQLDQSYAGTTIDIDIFDIGDLATNNPAWVGIQEPDGVTWAPATSMVDRGDYLSSTLNLNVSANWNGTDETNLCSGPANCATFQTAYASNGNAIYNGQWVQLQVQVPSTFGVPANCGGATNCWSKYWNLVYEVSAGATSGDTFSVQVGYAGSPDHLLP